MGAILDHTSRRARVHDLAAPAAIAAIVVALAVGDSSAGEGLGVAAAAPWIGLAVLVLIRPGSLTALPLSFAAAGALLVALTALTAVSLGWGYDDGAGFEEAVRVGGYAGYFVLAGLLGEYAGPRRLLAGLLIGFAGVALIALGSRLLGLGEGDAALADQLPTAVGRLSHPIGYWNGLGALMAMALPLLIHFSATSRGLARRLAFAGFAPVLLTAYMTSSRGALLAALLGAAIVIVRARPRGLAAAALLVGIAGALPAIAAAILGEGLLDSPGDGTPGGPELVAVAALLLGAFGAAVLGPAVADRLARLSPPRPRIPRTALVAGLLVAATGLVALAGPNRLVDDFRSFPDERRTDQATGILSASGSGRAQFWEAAIDGWTESPVHGLGAGGFAAHWNRTNDVGTPTRNAHSEPLEHLAELGLLGFACFVGLAGVVLAAALRAARRGPDAVAALGVLAVGGVGYLIDWTWSVPAVTVPVLFVAGAVTAAAFGPVGRRLEPPRTARPALACAVLIAAAAVVWSGAVLGASAAKLDESRSELAAGSAASAARSAREAIAIQPWAAEPWLQLASAERSVDNTDAALRAAGEAVKRAPEDFRPWLLAALVAGSSGRADASRSYALRAFNLAPNVLLRLREFVPELASG